MPETPSFHPGSSRTKQPEELQAQVADFAADQLQGENQKHVLNNVVEISASPPAELRRVAQNNEYQRIPEGYIKTPAGTEVLVATPEDYVRYLQEVGGASHDPIKLRTTLLLNYRDFQAAAQAPTEHIASTSKIDAYAIDHNGRKYVIRIPKSPIVDVVETDRKLRAAMLGLGMPHLEQVVAASYENGQTIAEHMVGTSLDQVSAQELASQATDDQLRDFIGTLTAAYDAGIVIDPKTSNIFYDERDGFGIIDYLADTHEPGRSPTTRADAIGFGAGALSATGINLNRRNDPSYKDYFLAQRKANLTTLRRYRDLCQSLFEGDELAAINLAIGNFIKMLETELQPPHDRNA
jgi:hypothetical protein